MTTDTITLEYASKLHREQEVATAQLTEATERRNQAVLYLVENGTRPVAVARELGISPTRVGQIVRAAREAAQTGLGAAA